MRMLAVPLLILSASAVWSREDLIPSPLPESRYEKMMEQSPFALSTAAPPPEAPKASFAANWTLTGLARMADKDGMERYFVTIRSRDKRVALSICGDEVVKNKDPDVDGVSIASVEMKPQARKSTVMLQKGAEMAKVEFGEESAPPAAPAPAPKPGNSILPGRPASGQGNVQSNIPGQPGYVSPLRRRVLASTSGANQNR